MGKKIDFKRILSHFHSYLVNQGSKTMVAKEFVSANPDEMTLSSDSDPQETKEWVEAISVIAEEEGPKRAEYVLGQVIARARDLGIRATASFNTPYINTISLEDEAKLPMEAGLFHQIQAIIRWNAVAMVLQAGKRAPELGGHIATYASAATLYEVGFQHFFHAPTKEHGGDLLYIQGHSSPGIYARAFLEGRLTLDQLTHFRQEVFSPGLSSYPHPWLMPNFWQFATVSMGLGPLQAIYQARFMKYMHSRQLINGEHRKVWAFLGDGEMDEPESTGAISLAGREKLDNLIFVVNCNLQRLDGPVRGNGKIIQELEALFRGAGWHVIKVVWGSHWDPLLAKDKHGLLLKRMEECCDGDYQSYKVRDGAYVREHFFGKYPELAAMVEDMSDEEIWHLNRGGHDPQKVYAAYHAATHHKGQPVLILAKTVKGYGMGAAGEGQNITHQQKKMTMEQVSAFRDRFNLPLNDEEVSKIAFYKPAADSVEITTIKEQRQKLGGYLPARQPSSEVLAIPDLNIFSPLLESSGEREISTTMAFVRCLNILLKDKNLSSRLIPIIPDECRTFGMEGMFRQYGIYSPWGQLYTPEDSAQVMYYREARDGQVLEEGITEAGAFCSWLAAATSYANHHYPLIPFFIYYSMFGFQRIGDLAWAAADMRARGFLLGGTAGRTTLNGEGLQHQDGHSHILSSTIPNCISYDPTYAYEVAVIMQDGLKRMYEKLENVFYYITLMNENYQHPAIPEGAEEGIRRGMYLLQAARDKSDLRVNLFGSGTILREALAAVEILAEYKVAANVWSVTSFTELRREGLTIERENLLHPNKKAKIPYVTQCLQDYADPVIAATDYMRSFADQIRAFVPSRYVVLGTDGFGRSDTREHLRDFFEVNRNYIALAALKALADEGKITVKVVSEAIKKLGIDADRPNPVTV